MGSFSDFISTIRAYLTEVSVREVTSNESGGRNKVLVEFNERLDGGSQTFHLTHTEDCVIIPAFLENTDSGRSLQSILVGEGYQIRYEQVLSDTHPFRGGGTQD